MGLPAAESLSKRLEQVGDPGKARGVRHPLVDGKWARQSKNARGNPNQWSIENSQHQVKGRSWDEDIHTLGRPGLGAVLATLVNTGLNALGLGGWFPTRMSVPLRAKTCPFRPAPAIARLYGQFS